MNVTPPPPRPPIVLPPSYRWSATCEVCWEACTYNNGIIGRWWHRRRFGHNPLAIGHANLKRSGETERERRERVWCSREDNHGHPPYDEVAH